MRKLYSFLVAVVLFSAGNVNAQVSVTATLGTTGPTVYATVNAAFTAINTGIHQGVVTISVTANTTEPATPIPLLASGIGSSSYTAITIKPSTTGIVINSAATPTTGRGILELQGADNVTIDGSSTGGTTKDLTIQSVTAATTGQACIRLSSNSVTGLDGANNNTIKNCIIVGARSSATSTVANYGIVFSNAAAAITTTLGAYSSVNTLIQNNIITRCYYGIHAIGNSATYLNTGTQIIGNTIGSATAASAVAYRAIDVSYTASTSGVSSVLISGNDVRTGFTAGTSTMYSVEIGASEAGAIITKNNIHDCINTTSSVWGMYGIGITGASAGITITNNFIRDIEGYPTVSSLANQYAGICIGVTAAATGLIINHNTFAQISNVCLGTNIFISSAGVTVSQFQNNIVSSNVASAYAMLIYTAATGNISGAAMTNNDYYMTATSYLGAYNGTAYGTLALWQTATSKDAGSFNVLPPYVSATDPHINNSGANVTTFYQTGVNLTASVPVDIDGQTRNNPPCIGADEFTIPANDAGIAGLVGPYCAGSQNVIVKLKNYGGAALTSATISWTVNGIAQAPFSFSGSIASGATANVTIGTYTFTAATSYSVVITSSLPNGATDANNANDSYTSPTFEIGLSGNYNVGAGQTYGTLTAAIAAANVNGLCGPTTFLLTDANYSTSETFPITINQLGGSSAINTLTIRPASSVTSLISGSASSNALIILNGADYITIDGSNTGGTDKSLTITNTSTTSPTGINVASLGTGAGATNNTIKNCNISTGTTTSTFSYGISVGGVPGFTGGDNDNITIQNNSITVANESILAYGLTSVSSGGMDNLTIIGNTLTSNNISNTSYLNVGMQIGNTLNSIITLNTIDVNTAAGGQPVGISLEAGVNLTSVTKNKITRVYTAGTGGYGGRGITIGTGLASSNITIANNFIAGVNGASNYTGFTNSSSMGIAIGVQGGSTTFGTTTGGINLYHNSVNMAGTYSYTANCLTAALYVGTGTSSLDIRNNIFTNTLTNSNATYTATSKSYALYSAIANAAFTNINNNDYYVGTTGGMLGYLSSDRATLAALQTATAQDGASVNVAPVFTSATDLHLPVASNTALNDLGTPSVGITTDIDGDTRPATGSTNPDMGADEFTPPANDAGITGLSGSFCPGTQNVNVVLKNFASATLTGVTINWSVNGTAQTPYVWSGSLGSVATTIVTLGTYTFAAGTNYTIIATTVSPNGMTDANTANDSFTSATFQTGLSGTIPVGAGQTFTTLTAAVAAANTNGLCGPTIFSLTDASYSGTETFPIVINQLSGSSATNTLTIVPAAGNSVTISGSVASGALIKLNGADYVTIDGSNNGTATQNLTVTNTNTTSPTSVSFVSLGTGAGATFDVLKNCIINTGTTASTTGYGIAIGGSTPGTAGADNDNITIQNNSITVANVSIYASGTAAASAGGDDNIIISGNTVSSTNTTNTTVNNLGIQVAYATNAIISLNTIDVNTATSTQPAGISLETGFINSLVSKNKITRVNTTATGGYGGRGIQIATGQTGSNDIISNNFVAGVNGSNYSGFTNSSSIGIAVGVNSGTVTTTTGGVSLYYNSVNMYGTYTYSASCITAALYIGTGATALDIRDNIFVNTLSNSNATYTTTSASYSIYSGAANTAFSNINYNDYYVGTAATGGVLGYLGGNLTTLTALKTATGQDAQSQNILPVFTSPTDLHLIPLSNGSINNLGTPLSITDDIDADTRDASAPDMGADEFTPPANDAGITALVGPFCAGTQNITVTLKNYGSDPLLSANIDWTVNGIAQPTYNWVGGPILPGGTLNIVIGTYNFVAATNYTFIVTSSSPNLLPDLNTTNDSYNSGIFQTGLSGTILVGASQAAPYNTLTGAIGAANSYGLCGPTVLSLTDATYSTSETFPIVLNALTGSSTTNTLTIRPAGSVLSTVTGNSGTSLLKLNGADNVIIDGSNAGTTSRDLTFTNTNTATGTAAMLWIGSASSTNGATNNIVKNTILTGTSTTLTFAGIISSSGTTIGGVAEAANTGNLYRNNLITTSYYGIQLVGPTGNENSNVVDRNIIGSATAANKIGVQGIFSAQEQGVTITNNTILGVNSPTNILTAGIYLAGSLGGGGNISNNIISDIKNTVAGGRQAFGIEINSASAAGGLNIYNNIIFDVSNAGTNATLARGGHGMSFLQGSGYNVYYNTVNLNTDQGAAATVSNNAALYVAAAVSGLDVRDNIFVNTQTNGNRYAIYSDAANTAFTGIDYNDYYSSGASLGFIGSARTLLSDIVAGFGQNANSISVAPVFVSATDMHLTPSANTAIDNTGTPAAPSPVTVDIDGETRPLPPSSATDPGADEFNVPLGLDMGVTALTAPPVKSCYTNSEAVTATIKNYSVNTIDFSLYPVTVTVNVTGAVTQTLPYTINTGTLASNATQSVPVGTLDMTAAGNYVFNAYTTISGGTDVTPSNNALSPAITRTVVTPTPGTVTSSITSICGSGTPTLSLTGSAGGTIQWQESPAGAGTWSNVGSNASTYTPGTPITASMDYRAQVICATTVTSNVVTVSVNSPMIVTTVPGSRCGTGTVSLGATGTAGSTLNWYASPTGNTVLGTGTTFTTPSISTTTTYYVDATNGLNSGSEYVGFSGNATTTNTTSVGSHGIAITTTIANTMIYSADIPFTGTGTFTIALKDVTNSTVISSVVTGSFTGSGLTPVTIPINLNVVTPGNYLLIVNAVSGTINNLGYVSNAVYPYTTSTGAFSITSGYWYGTDAADNMYFFHLNVSGPCKSARTAVAATVSTPPALALSTNAVSICSGSTSSLVTLTSTQANYDVYSLTPSTGATGNVSSGWTFNPTSTTTYTLNASQTSGSFCATSTTITVTVNQTPTAVIVTPSAPTICSGTVQLLTASGGQLNTASASGQIGTGTTAPGATAFPNPLSSYYGGQKTQMLFTAAELTTLGLSANSSINTLGFNMSAVNTSGTLNDFTLRIGATTATTLSGFISGTTTVYNVASYTPAATGVINFTLSTQFVWDGTSNIVVEVVHNAGNGGNGSGTRTRATATATNMTFYGNTDNVTPAGVASYDALTTYGTSSATTTRPNVYFGYTTPQTQPITWSPTTGLYTNAGGTTPYTGTATTTVYAKPVGTITYTATATSTLTGSCTKSANVTVTVTPQPNAVISYPGGPFCASGTATVSVAGTAGLTGGVYSISPVVTGAINSSTGAIDLSLLTGGTTYTILYSYAAAGGCALYTNSTTITVNSPGTWTGNAPNPYQTDWTNPANWTCGQVPTSSMNVTIPTGLIYYPVIGTSVNASVLGLSIATGATVTVNSTGILHLYGVASQTGTGTLIATAGTLDLVGGTIPGSVLSGNAVQTLTISGNNSSIATGAIPVKVTGNMSFLTGGNTFTTNGNLVVGSSASGTANVTDITNNGAFTGATANTIVGNASVERYIPAGRKWRFLAVNTTAGTGSKNSFQANWMEGQTPGANAGPAGYGMWITDVPGLPAFDATSYSPTIKWWNGSSYTGITDPRTASGSDMRLHNGAYMTYVRGDRSATGAAGNTIAVATRLRTYGNLAQNNQPYAVPTSPLYTTIGNPYASAIDLTKLAYTTSGAINIAVWDPNLAGGNDLGAFQYLTSTGAGQPFTINPGGGSYTTPGAGAAMGDIVNTIESGQAFFITAGGSGTATIREIAKVSQANPVFFTPSDGTVYGSLALRDTSAGTQTVVDGIAVHFASGYNTAVTSDDARKLGNTSENVSVKREGILLAVEYRNLPEATDTIQLNLASTRLRDYQWKFNLRNMSAPGRNAWLVDRYNNSSTVLNLEGSNTYNFTVTATAGTWAADRFYILFRYIAPPVASVISINATRQPDATVAVKWSATHETGIQYYQLESSADNSAFSPVNISVTPTNNAGGTADYGQLDTKASAGDIWYRIRSVSYTGAIKYSPVAHVDPYVKSRAIAVNPNPVSGRIIHLLSSGIVTGDYTSQITDAAGRVVFKGTVTFAAGTNRQDISLQSSIAPGEYLLQMTNDKGEKYSVRVTVL